MVGTTLLNVGIVLLLILIEGLFVAAEIALVSLRESQIRALAEAGRAGQAVAKLTEDPNRFLATVQIGVTSTALLSSAFGAVTLSDSAKHELVHLGWSDGLAGATGIIGVTLIISFVTLVLGELAPKRLALQRAEKAAQFFAPPLARTASFLRPVIWLLSRSTDVIVRLLGGDPGAAREPISEEELRNLVAAHESLGTDERQLIDDVFGAGQRSIDEVMVPRTEVTFLERSMTVSRAAKVAAESPHSRYPVTGRGQDDVVGFVHIRDLLLPTVRHERDTTVGSVAREIKAMPGSVHVLAAMAQMRDEGHHMAIVVDEYGGTDGIVTLEDLLEEVVGEIRDEYDADADGSRQLAGGEIEVDGKLNLDEIEEISGVALPEGPYATVAGFVMAELGRLPQTGDVVEHDGVRLTVVRTEGRRAARVRLTPEQGDDGTPPAPDEAPTAAAHTRPDHRAHT
ncbi:hemolysin family protein [uncultured Jatrophihabitans sp.]|uniref:hemolysin family protein n=1 Tax=uncultured Jatrophihabitans sp. TaxID=1610747 RepID=UPI0035CC9CC4